jgi:phospholipase/carboxylesterase
VSSRVALCVLLFLCTFGWPLADVAAGDLTYLAHQPTRTSGHPPLIILLHGSGADENDMLGLWPQLPDQFVVISPRAPFADAGGGYRWYRKAAKSRSIEPDIVLSRRKIDDLVEVAVKRFGADPAQVFVAGFSQWAVMVYDIALREPGRFRGAAVLSGSLFASAQAAISAGADRSHESIFIGHGTGDQRIPLSAAVAAHENLEKLGLRSEFHVYRGMSHEISDAEVKDLDAWLTKRLRD